MDIEQKEFAKTFDTKLDSFVIIKEKMDLELLEAMRFIQSQINTFESKLDRIIKTLEHDRSGFASQEGIRKVEELDRQYKLFDAKMSLQLSLVGDIEKDISVYSESADRYVSISDTKDFVLRISELEKIGGETSAYNFKDIFLNLVEVMGTLGKKINNLEGIIGRYGAEREG